MPFTFQLYLTLTLSGLILWDSVSPGITRVSWSNWSAVTVLVSLFGSLGGLLVAATLKYADSIMKCLATSGAIVISTVLGHYILDGPMDSIMCIGGGVVIISILNYTLEPKY